MLVPVVVYGLLVRGPVTCACDGVEVPVVAVVCGVELTVEYVDMCVSDVFATCGTGDRTSHSALDCGLKGEVPSVEHALTDGADLWLVGPGSIPTDYSIYNSHPGNTVKRVDHHEWSPGPCETCHPDTKGAKIGSALKVTIVLDGTACTLSNELLDLKL